MSSRSSRSSTRSTCPAAPSGCSLLSVHRTTGHRTPTDPAPTSITRLIRYHSPRRPPVRQPHRLKAIGPLSDPTEPASQHGVEFLGQLSRWGEPAVELLG